MTEKFQPDTLINDDLCLRLREGTYGHPACLAVLFLTTSVLMDHPAAMSATATLFALIAAGRIALVRKVELRRRYPVAWRACVDTLLISGGLLWGGLTAWCMVVYGYGTDNTYSMLLYSSAVAVIGTAVFLHNLPLSLIYLTLLFAPPSLAYSLKPEMRGFSPPRVYLLYYAFLAARACRMCASYRKDLAQMANLAEAARRDSLTGLPNRLAVHEFLMRETETAKKDGRTLGLIYIDLDGFKAVNDLHSHETGDQLLRVVAQRLTACAGGQERLARLGGDEFLMVPKRAESAALQAAEILEKLSGPISIGGEILHIGASVGIAFFPEDADCGDALIRQADHAMYDAKRAGRNRICFAGAGADLNSLARATGGSEALPEPIPHEPERGVSAGENADPPSRRLRPVPQVTFSG